jgi:pimeloyl-ACP methyl ester carboxylesterase
MTSRRRIFATWQAEADLWIRSGWRVSENILTGDCRLRDADGTTRACGSAAECRAAGCRLAPSPRGRTAVLLLHGMGRTRRCMTRLEHAAAEAGFMTANAGYPSLRQPLAVHAARIAGIAVGLAEDGAATIHLVGHSLGGLVARRVMADKAVAPGRLVTIGAPNQGALLADRLQTCAAYRRVFGACGEEVSRAAAGRLPIPETEIGVIAGGNGAHGYNPFLDGDNDGVVTVAETRLGAREADFLLVPTFHTVLMNHRHVIAGTMSFLSAGRFTD